MRSETTSTGAPAKARLPPGYKLAREEAWWRDQGELLLRHGYELRPRFRPGWVPSWIKPKKKPIYCDDFYINMHPKTIDAKRVSDGKRVEIKKLFKGSKELQIARYLSSDEFRDISMNHCVPILDVINEADDPLEFMVMPLLTTFDVPPYSTVDEVLDFMKQTLEGLAFLHSKGVAHRDCSDLNIMMDGDSLFPKGFHPSTPILDASAKYAKPRRRRDVGGVKYYFTDFGISTWFDGTEKNRLVTGEDGQDQDVPELHEHAAYDPFPVDIFILGNLLQRQFISMYENLSFLKPLVKHMTQQDPKDRPDANDALIQFNEAIEVQPRRSLRWELIFYDDTRFDRFVCTVSSLTHECVRMMKLLLR